MEKFYKTLDQSNQYFDYNAYWITHDGIGIVIRNYLFFLQVTQK